MNRLEIRKRRILLVVLAAVFVLPAVARTPLQQRLEKLERAVEVTPLESTRFDKKYELVLRQPLDWQAPEKGSFTTRIVVSPAGFDRPTILVTEGYGAKYAYRPDYREELSQLLDANIVFVEHRYFLGSTPDPRDWPSLTAAASACDLHDVRQLPGAIPAGNLDYCDKLLQWCLPPRILLMGLGPLWTAAMTVFDPLGSIKWWIVLLLLLFALALALPDEHTDRHLGRALRRLRFPVEAEAVVPALDSRREMVFRRSPHAVRQREQARHVHQCRLDGRQIVLQARLNFVAHFSLHVRGKFPDCAPSAPPVPATLASARCSPWANRFARSRSGRVCRP